jgi:hypothetical protein
VAYTEPRSYTFVNKTDPGGALDENKIFAADMNTLVGNSRDANTRIGTLEAEGGVPADGSVTNAKVATNAAIALSKTADDTASAGRLAMTNAERTKLGGVATAATANSTDAQLRDRSTHTGAQAISTVTSLQTTLDAKVAAVTTGAKLWIGTQAAYDAIGTKDATTLYAITG